MKDGRLRSIVFPITQQPPLSQGLLIIKASRSHSVRHTKLGRTPLGEWSALAESSTWQYAALTRDRYPCPRRDSNPQSQQVSGRIPTP